MELVTLIIAIIGAVSGLLALLVQTLEYVLKRPKVECELDKIKDSYWIHGNELKYKDMSQSSKEIAHVLDVVVLSLIISNKKNIPVTIEGIFSDNGIPFVDDINFETPKVPLNFPNGQPAYQVFLSYTPEMQFPTRIEAYDVLKTSIVFLDNRSSLSNRAFNLLIKTPYKKFPFAVTVTSAAEHAKHKKVGLIRANLVDDLNQYKKEAQK